jgi:hypothetical protein
MKWMHVDLHDGELEFQEIEAGPTVDEILACVDRCRVPEINGKYLLYISPLRIAQMLRCVTEKRPKRGYFKLSRDLGSFLPKP